jgi:carotenoid cleavage dioxygenase-like enzyme
MIHDFVITENYVIFPLFPCTMSLVRMMRGENIFIWKSDSVNTFFIVVNREGNNLLYTQQIYL